jgi:hypothetical protein
MFMGIQAVCAALHGYGQGMRGRLANAEEFRGAMAKKIETSVKDELLKMLDGSQAHATFDDAVADFPVKLRGVVVDNLPYSAWQILDHIRIAQRDILQFSTLGTDYKPMKWPDEYWPKDAEPPSEGAWDDAVRSVIDDRNSFEALVKKTSEADLVKPFEWGDGQTLMREVLLVIDHSGYHTGELVMLRRLLGAWKK